MTEKTDEVAAGDRLRPKDNLSTCGFVPTVQQKKTLESGMKQQ